MRFSRSVRKAVVQEALASSPRDQRRYRRGTGSGDQAGGRMRSHVARDLRKPEQPDGDVASRVEQCNCPKHTSQA
jgi:hypothetical protein